MGETPIPNQLPDELRRYFWDVDASTLNPAEHPKYVINRMLNIGNVAAVRWVRQHFPEHLITKTLKTIRDFSPKTATFWANVYHIPKEEMACMQEPYLSMRKRSWHN